MVPGKTWRRALGFLLLAGFPIGYAMTTLGAEKRLSPGLKTAGNTTAGYGLHYVRQSPKVVATLDTGLQSITCEAIDGNSDYAYYGDNATPPQIAKVRLADLQCVCSATLGASDGNLTSAFVDNLHGWGYFTHQDNSSPLQIVKVRLSDLSGYDSMNLNSFEVHVPDGAIDVAGGNLYLINNGAPLSIVKVNLATFRREGSLTVTTSTNQSLCCPVLDPSGGFLYAGVNTGWSSDGSPSLASVVKVRLSDFKVVAELPLTPCDFQGIPFNVPINALHTEITAAAIDVHSGKVHYVFNAWPDAGKSAPYNTLATSIPLSTFPQNGTSVVMHKNMVSADSFMVENLWIDAIHSFAYRGVYFYKYGPGPMGGSGGLAISRDNLADFGYLDCISDGPRALFDSSGNFAYVHSGDYKIVNKCDLGVPFKERDATLASMVALPEIARVRDVRFYSRSAMGQVRLGIYTDTSPKTLLWQSGAVDNDRRDDWLTVPINQGTPASLTLPAGQYWLAWQATDPGVVASYTPALSGTGFVAPWPGTGFGPCPQFIGPGESQPTNFSWSEYLTYEAPDAADGWTRYR